MNKLIIFILAGVCILFSSSHACSQDLDKFCKDLKLVLDDVRKSRSEWQTLEYKNATLCFFRIYPYQGDDIPDIFEVTAILYSSERQAASVQDKARNGFKDKANLIDISSTATGWQSMFQNGGPSHKGLTVFGQNKRLWIQVSIKELPERERVLNFILNYKFDQ